MNKIPAFSKGCCIEVAMATAFAARASVMKELPQVQRLDAIGKRLWGARRQALQGEATRRKWFHQWNRFATFNNRFRMSSEVCAKHLADNMSRIIPDLKP